LSGAWKGELVKAEIVEEKSSFVKTRLVELLEPSPERISGASEAGIPGCVYANLSLTGENAAKRSQIAEFFSRARLWDGEIETSDVVSPLNYRNKAVYHFAKTGEGWAIGYRKERSHEIVDVASDPLAVKEINARLPEIRQSVKALLTNGSKAVRQDVERKGTLTVRWSPKSGVNWWLGEAPQRLRLKEVTLGTSFEVPAGGFYQVNPLVGEELVKCVAGEVGRLSPDELYDLYCGVGVFGVCCRPKRLVGVEYLKSAVDVARQNAERAGVESEFFAGAVARNISRFRFSPSSAVIVDPPRGGMERGVAAALAKSGAGKIFYVSCDPATLTRDLKTLASAYAVERVKWFNMFARTARFETLVTLKRK
jgi:tRNA/tmRNA/rRNA uracil-C5-methylase (TrmA/RlmC/RlmD family)